MKNSIRRLVIPLLSLPVLLRAQTTDLRSSFHNPPADTRPGCYWYWINDNISKEGLTKDLEAMARVGIGRAYIGHIFLGGDKWDPKNGKVTFMSDAWWDALQWAVKEADRCGVEIGFFNSPGWSQSGGPWVKPSESMRYLDASETVIEGGRRIDQVLPVPEIHTFPNTGGSKPEPTGPKFSAKDFQDVRVVAFLQPETETNDIDMTGVRVSSPTPELTGALLDDSAKTSAKIGPNPAQIDFDLGAAAPVQSLSLDPAGHSFVLTCVIAVSEDGKAFREIARHTEERGHQGPRNQDPLLIPFPETKSKHLRVTLSSNKPAAFSELALSRRAVIAHYARKQLGEIDPSTLPAWNAYIWGPQPAAAPGSAINSAKVIDLTNNTDATGRLVWDAPPGRWVVMRAGMVPIGTQCAPASAQSRGLEVDKMNRDHIKNLFDGMVGEFLRRTPAADRKAFKYVIADSYETGPQNWTDGLIGKFEKRFGYSPVRFLPCLHGRVIDSPVVSTRFLWDWRRLIAESIATEYVGGLRDISNRNGLTLWLENYGHWGFPSEFLLYGAMTDQVGGEFWESGDPLGNIELRAAASCSHIYGRAEVYAETFTSNRSFEQTPASIKPWCDWAYGAGINHHILHVYIHQTDDRKPGITAWFGTAFNRHNTWFEHSKGFIDYTRRNTVLLKAGLPVIDVAYCIGENAPSMQGPRDPALPDGYDFDFINSDVLINRATVKDGRISIPNGPSYAVLVLPKQTVMRPEVAEAIRRLVRDGASVIGPKPAASPSLAGFPECDERVASIAAEVWGPVDGGTVKSRAFGKGTIHDGVDIPQVLALSGLGVLPDVQVISKNPLTCAAAGAGKIGIGGKGGIVFKHRSTPDREIYFLSNTTDQSTEFTASLRVTGRKPELWNADRGEITAAPAFTQRDGRTHIPLRLNASESIHIVFGEKIPADASADTPPPEYSVAAGLDGPWTVRFDGQGAPKEIVFPSLIDWRDHADAAIRGYSGTASYETRFTLVKPDKSQRTVLSLGEVAVIATVIVNGKTAGSVWTNPWEIDISDLVKAGENTVEIRVANQWHNRLVTDAALPPGKRLTHSSAAYKAPGKEPFRKSGLLGPVRVRQCKSTVSYEP